MLPSRGVSVLVLVSATESLPPPSALDVPKSSVEVGDFPAACTGETDTSRGTNPYDGRHEAKSSARAAAVIDDTILEGAIDAVVGID